MSDLIAFLNARLDEREARARQMLETVWPERVAIMPSDDTGDDPACVSISEYGPKAWKRVWRSGQVEHGWVLAPTAIEVWSPEIAQEMLADVDAKRRLLAAIEPDLGAASGEVAAHALGPELMRWARANAIARILALPFADHPDCLPEWRP